MCETGLLHLCSSPVYRTVFYFPKNWENPNNEGRYRIFENCPNLLSVTVPEGVKTIPAYAFSYANCIE